MDDDIAVDFGQCVNQARRGDIDRRRANSAVCKVGRGGLWIAPAGDNRGLRVLRERAADAGAEIAVTAQDQDAHAAIIARAAA